MIYIHGLEARWVGPARRPDLEKTLPPPIALFPNHTTTTTTTAAAAAAAATAATATTRADRVVLPFLFRITNPIWRRRRYAGGLKTNVSTIPADGNMAPLPPCSKTRQSAVEAFQGSWKRLARLGLVRRRHRK